MPIQTEVSSVGQVWALMLDVPEWRTLCAQRPMLSPRLRVVLELQLVGEVADGLPAEKVLV